MQKTGVGANAMITTDPEEFWKGQKHGGCWRCSVTTILKSWTPLFSLNFALNLSLMLALVLGLGLGLVLELELWMEQNGHTLGWSKMVTLLGLDQNSMG